MIPVTERVPIGVAPWNDAPRVSNHSYKSVSGLYYRGWTLVDDRGFRWASKDGTLKRVRVCRDVGVQTTEAIKMFHEVVDREEGS